jgi:hypothetical protein
MWSEQFPRVLEVVVPLLVKPPLVVGGACLHIYAGSSLVECAVLCSSEVPAERTRAYRQCLSQAYTTPILPWWNSCWWKGGPACHVEQAVPPGAGGG